MTPVQQSPAATWPDVIRRACWLWLRVSAGDQDHRSSTSGHTLIYAVDASVAGLYAQPMRSIQHAQMLGFLDEDILADLAYVLGHLCLRCAERTGGFILLPGHDEEFLRVFGAVRNQFQEIMGNRSPLLLENLLSTSSLNSVAAGLRRKILENPIAVGAEFIAAKFEILHGILRDKNFDLARWYDFVSRSSLKAAADPALNLPIPNFSDGPITKLQEVWYEAIRAERPLRRSALTIEDDAQAVATLGWLNTELENKGDLRRIVLLTLDDGLQLAALKNPGLPGATAIRDPRQFVRELPSTIGTFLDNPTLDSTAFGVLEWLTVLLSPFSSGGTVDPQTIMRLASATDDRLWRAVVILFRRHHQQPVDDDRLGHAKTEWQRFIRLGVNRYAVDTMQNDPRLRMIAQVVEDGDEIGLQAALTTYIVDTASDASVSSLVAGLYLSLGTRKPASLRAHTVYRMPVAIRSDPAERDSYLRFMDEAVKTKNLNSVKPFAEFEEKYLAHLYYGIYFAAIGNWEATETLARSALAFLDIGPQRDTNRSFKGIEISYLLAVTYRHRVRSPDDLARAEQALAQVGQRREQNGLHDCDPRLVVERVALNLQRAFATMLLGPEWRGVNELLSTRKMAGLLGQARTLIEEESSDELFKQIVTKQILGDIMVIGLYEFMFARNDETVIYNTRALTSTAKDLDALLEKLKTGRPLAQAAQSRYIDILVGFGHWATGKISPAEREEWLALIDAACEDPEMPYDRPKYERLRQLVDNNAR